MEMDVWGGNGTYITHDHRNKSHAADGSNSAGFLDPVVPPVREDGDPAFCHERLHEDEHAEGEGDEGEREVVEDSHGCRKSFLGGVVGGGYEG